jgi:cytochrome c5
MQILVQKKRFLIYNSRKFRVNRTLSFAGEKAMLKKLITALVIASVAIGSANATHNSAEKVSERTKPVGKVYREGDDIPKIAPVLSKPAGPRSVEDIYSTKCLACHATGAAGAPKVGDVAAWVPLLARGIDDLLASAIKGKGAMPAKGMCTDCTDDELKATIQSMMDQSK